jgi:hypothetical protein
MPDEHPKESTEKAQVGADKGDAPVLNGERHVSANAVDAAESKRTNASDGSMNRFQKIDELEPSVEINFGSTVVSRRNAVTESQVSGKHNEQLLAQAAPHSAESKPKGAGGIASAAEDLHEHHSEDFRNHGNVYTCAMFVNRALKLAGYNLTYEKGVNPNMVASVEHSLAHNRNFESVSIHPYKPAVGDVVIFGPHHSGIISEIGPEGAILTYGGSTQTQKTGSTPLNILEKSPGFAGAPTHVFRVKAAH